MWSTTASHVIHWSWQESVLCGHPGLQVEIPSFDDCYQQWSTIAILKNDHLAIQRSIISSLSQIALIQQMKHMCLSVTSSLLGLAFIRLKIIVACISIWSSDTDINYYESYYITTWLKTEHFIRIPTIPTNHFFRVFYFLSIPSGIFFSSPKC